MSFATRPMRLLLVAVVIALLGAACAPTESGDASSGGGEGGELSGSISISGSSTVEPISAANAEKFSAENPGVQISVDGPGTGDGFELFCQGDTDISDASRPIDPEEEIPACEENGVEFIELKVAVDGISVVTSPENDLVECLSFPDLYALLGPESEGFSNWSDANDLGKEVGGSGDYPDAKLSVTAPGEESGTYDSFAELVLEDIAVEERKQPEDGPFVRPDYQASGDDNVIIEGIAGNATSLGWVGYAFYSNASDTVRAIPIEEEEGSGCVEPTDETIASGEYPIARDLYIYVNKAKAEENEALSAYVDFYLSQDGLASVSEVGYVDLTNEAIAETTSAWEEREVGTRVE
ncbi:MAG: phosphate ABC transporter substrate-binding protein PstS family protein [Actinomycetota bacterium]